MKPSVNALRCAEKRIRIVNNPTTAMIAPTTSNLRSSESESHHESGDEDGEEKGEEEGSGGKEIGKSSSSSGGGGSGNLNFGFALAGAVFRDDFPFFFFEEESFDFFLENEKGILSGMMLVRSIAQMVWFSLWGKIIRIPTYT